MAASPTSEWFAKYSQPSRTEIVTVPLTKDYAHDLDAMLARSGSGPTLVYICNPSNPTGTPTRQQDLEEFVRKLPATARVLIDEAYHHYVSPSAGYGSWLDRVPADPRVIVTRSFSKIHGLAGLRIGYAVAAPETARLLRLHELEDGVNVVSAMAALIALNDDEHVRTSLARNADDRQEFFNEANARMLRVIDSQANFVMLNCRPPGGAHRRALPEAQRCPAPAVCRLRALHSRVHRHARGHASLLARLGSRARRRTRDVLVTASRLGQDFMAEVSQTLLALGSSISLTSTGFVAARFVFSPGSLVRS